jgi:mRNA interferase MazF
VRRFDIAITLGGAYTAKHRPGVVVRISDNPDSDAVTVVPLSSVDNGSKWTMEIPPSEKNGLQSTSYAMADRVTTIKRQHLGKVIGHLECEHSDRLTMLIIAYVGNDLGDED